MTSTAPAAKDDFLGRITRDYDVWAYVAMDTVGLLTERVRALVETGRPMTVITRYKDSGDRFAEAQVEMGLRVREGGMKAWTQSAPAGTGLEVLCEPRIVSWGFGAYAKENATEEQVVRRHHDATRADRFHSVTMVEIHGRPDTREARVTITYWNEFGVGRLTDIVFGEPVQPHRPASVLTGEQAVGLVHGPRLMG